MNPMTQRYLIFIFVIGAMMSFLTLPGFGMSSTPITQPFNPNGINQQITSSAQNAIQTTIQAQVTTSQGTASNKTSQTCTSTGGDFATQVQLAVCNFNIAWREGLAGLICSVNNAFNN